MSSVREQKKITGIGTGLKEGGKVCSTIAGSSPFLILTGAVLGCNRRYRRIGLGALSGREERRKRISESVNVVIPYLIHHQGTVGALKGAARSGQ